ncbi:MAG: alpha-ribazole phosphatase [Actinobacteria bacterium]|nr:alpha-ribazole phosphatase [Actinomycetota bacterium]
MGVKLFLIRHGQTEWNKEGRYQGGMDTELTGTGIEQAKLAAEYLSQVDFSNIYSSPLKRAVDTAEIISRGESHRIIVRDDLREMNFGRWEGLKFSEINNQYNEDYQNWLRDPYNNRPAGGESFEELSIRALREADNIVAENENKIESSVAVITHGGVILALLVCWLQIPVSRWKSIIQRQGAINVVVIDRGFPYISAVNFTGHLHPVYDENEDRVIRIYGSLGNGNSP